MAGYRGILGAIMRPPRPSPRSGPRTEASPAASAAANREAAILAVVRSIPRGRVTTYGQVAARAGLPRNARLVGRVLSGLPGGTRVPWQRVVAAGGRIAFAEGSAACREQVARLRSEGVSIVGRRVDLGRHGWAVPDGDLDRWLWEAPNAKRVHSAPVGNTYDGPLLQRDGVDET
jgi:methylated-DNA-protein-cysteine methyltransferase-like protein